MKNEEKKFWEIPGTSREDITPESIFLDRRRFMKNSLLLGVASFASHPLLAGELKFPAKLNEKFKLSELSPTKEDIATSYNNFYEFSLEKSEVKTEVSAWHPPADWKIEVAGLADKKKSYSVDELMTLSGATLEERIYRFRCVEGWSMVVPWTGFPLSQLMTKLGPKSSAKFVKFQTFSDHKGTNMSSQPGYPWPYTEGLTVAEAMNPLAFVAVGMYGKALPKQNGAPIRIVVPWKYGFKSIKSIARIELTDTQPKTLWNELAPNEYGFYANVNPKVDHPRWSQSSERVIDGSFFPKHKPTLMFNGYESQVADLYKGVDLTKNF